MFRYTAFNKARERYTLWQSIIMISLVFALLHSGLINMIYAFILGLLVSYVYVNNGNILYPMVMHIAANGTSLFINNFNILPDNIKNSLVIEYYDKIYNARDVLNLCKKINRPMVLDYHHHICNPCDNIDDILKEIFDTWKDIRPKVHFSSPKNKTKRDFRSHHDYISIDDFIQFIEKIKKYNVDIDVMIEAKAKDDALFRLVRELKYKTNYKFIDETSFEV